MKTTFRVLFLVRKTRLNKDGSATVMARITVGGDFVEFNSKVTVDPTLWNPIGRVTGRSKDAKDANDMLDKIRANLKMHYDNLYDRDGYVTPEKLRDSYLGIEIQQYTLIMLYDKKVEQKRNLVGKVIRDTTLCKYTATKKRMEDYLEYQYKKKDIPVRDITFSSYLIMKLIFARNATADIILQSNICDT